MISYHQTGRFAVVEREGWPYIWMTWLTRLQVGENSCEWAVWFRAQHEGWSWTKVPNGFDQMSWQVTHIVRVNETRQQ